ncbi:hypothetical protein PENDEC_c014G04054 [Penicillium decumbens]|uniref:Uncharacterized protein n=1 Tax=Penicillium decumbens TaxID=69771 RepID=A0A1V6P9H5_PENDC|nr:hypothetical protein PENDEC_c014G04054 [Penicillium decumbens]
MSASRSVIGCARKRHSRLDKFQRHSQVNPARKKGFWNSEREQLHDRMAHLKKNVSEYGYYAIFGHRLDSHRMDQHDIAWPSFLRSFINTEPVASENPSKAYL